MTPDEIIAGLPEEEQAAPVEAAEEPIAESPAEEVSAEAVPVEEAPVEAAPAEEAAAEEAPAAPAPKKKMKKKRHPAIRVLCGILGTILVILMIIPAFLGLTVANLQNITSQAVISQILNGILTSAPVESPFPALRAPLTAGVGTAPGDLDVGGIDVGDIDIGDLTGENSTDFVVDIVYDIIQDQFGGQVEVTKEEMSDFLEESTAKDFVVEKVSGLVSDMINGTNNTTITIEEINTLVEENAQLIEDHFDIVITEEQKGMVSQVVEDSGVLDAIEKDGLLGVVEQMTTVPDTDAPGSGEEGSDSGNGDAQAPSKPNAGGLGGMMETITMIRETLEMFRQVASTQNLLICIGVFLFMSLLVFFLNNMGIPGTLVGMGIPVLLVGGLYSAPSIIAVNASDMIIGMLAENMEGGALVGKAVVTAFAVIMPLNVTVMCVGAGMIVLAIVLKIILSQKAKKAALAA